MAPSSTILRAASLALALTALPVSVTSAAELAYVVFQNGRSIPLSAVVLQGDNLVVSGEVEGYSVGQVFPLPSVDHVYGERPAEIRQAVALLLLDKPKDALKLLEPLAARHRVTAKIPGNFWLEAARAMLVAYAVTGNSLTCSEVGRQISDVTPAPGIDPFVSLGKALLMPGSVKVEDRLTALTDLTVGELPADLCSYASYYRAKLFIEEKRNAEALESYLAVPCLFPSGGMILNAAAETKAAEMLAALGRREEAVALLKSAVRACGGTLLEEEANKRLESLK